MKSFVKPSERARYSLAWIFEHFFGEQQQLRDGVHKRVVERLKGHQGRMREIDRVKAITPAQFFLKYYLRGKPVVLDSAASEWACVQRWTPEMIADRYGDDSVRIIKAGPEQSELSAETEMTDLRTIIARMATDCTKYARFNPLLQEHPELLDDLDVGFLTKLTNKSSSGISYQLFLGGKGSATAAHNALANNLFVNIFGEKEWFLFSPKWNPVLHPPMARAPYFFTNLDPKKMNSEEYPEVEMLDGYRVTLKPGDILFVPSFFWHYVFNQTASIGVGYRWFSAYSVLKSSATQGLLTLTATNPPLEVTRANRHDFTKVFSLSNARPGAIDERLNGEQGSAVSGQTVH